MKENIRSIRTWLIVLFCLIPFCSCGDDHDESLIHRFGVEFLKQTAWKGELIYYSGETGEVFNQYRIGILFATDTQGRCGYLTTIGTEDGKDDYEDVEGFTYTVDDKLLTIKSSKISGWWLLEELTADRMVLIDGPQLQLNAQGKLVLDRVY